MTKDQLSPRQLRYDRTWNAIHNAAYELVTAQGMRATTVDEIAEKAGVSPRTFFNYFPTKDDAVLGLRAPKLTDEMLERDAQRGDRYVYLRIVMLLLEILESSMSERTRDIIIALAPEYPELKLHVKHLQMEAERILSDFLLSIDWTAFAEKGRRGDFVFLPEGEELPESAHRRVRASVYASYAVLRSVVINGALPTPEEREERIMEAIEILQSLLRED